MSTRARLAAIAAQGAALLRRHWLVAILVALAGLIRLLVMIAYRPAFYYFGDSGEYVGLSQHLEPHRLRPAGYPVLLMLLSPTHTFVAVVAVQHLAGLALGIGVYALLLRRGLPRGVASLAAAPVLFDSLQIDLEHFILTETLFVVLLASGVGVLLWRDRPGAVAGGAAGLLLAGAWFTRPVALAATVLLLGFLVVRRIGWRAPLAFVIAFAAPFAAVLVWVGDRPNTYTSGSASLFLYGRTAMFADCDRLVLPPEERAVCPTTEIDPQLAGRADWYIWVYLGPGRATDPGMDPVLQAFAIDVITQQPGDYLAVVARETAPYFVPWQYLGPGHDVLNRWWTLPASVRDGGGAPMLAGHRFSPAPIPPSQSPGATGLTRALAWYGTYVRSPALLNTAAVIAAAVAAIRLRRRRGWRDARDAALLAVLGTALIVLQVAINMYEPRQGVSALPLFCVAAALAFAALRSARSPRRRPEAAESSEDEAGAAPTAAAQPVPA